MQTAATAAIGRSTADWREDWAELDWEAVWMETVADEDEAELEGWVEPVEAADVEALEEDVLALEVET